MSDNAVATIERRDVVQAEPMTPMQMVAFAVQQGQGLDQIKELMQLEREWKADKAKEAYVAAMAAFKSEPISIRKDRTVDYTHNGKRTNYSHASLAEVVDAVVAAMGKHGLSHRWETRQDGGIITVACVITHQLGHSEHTTLSAGKDDSGSKNSIQAIGSTVTYLQRYTLMAATGVAAADQDDDGRKSDAPATIDEKQAADLEALITEVGADKAGFLKFCKIERLEDLLADKYTAAVQKLEAKRRKSREPGEEG